MRIEIERDVVSRGASVEAMDDVLAMGKTLCAVLQPLNEAGIGGEDVSVMAVAESPKTNLGNVSQSTFHENYRNEASLRSCL